MNTQKAYKIEFVDKNAAPADERSAAPSAQPLSPFDHLESLRKNRSAAPFFQ